MDSKLTLNELSYPSKGIKLSIVESQLLQSRKARGLNIEDSNNTLSFEKPSDFDLPLNETLNIIMDYLKDSEIPASAQKQIVKPREI